MRAHKKAITKIKIREPLHHGAVRKLQYTMELDDRK